MARRREHRRCPPRACRALRADPEGLSRLPEVFVLVYDPNARPQLTSPTASQLGYFRPTGLVETAATRASNNVVQLAQTIVLNYMALHDDVGRFDEVLPDHGLGSGADLGTLIAFQPIR